MKYLRLSLSVFVILRQTFLFTSLASRLHCSTELELSLSLAVLCTCTVLHADHFLFNGLLARLLVVWLSMSIPCSAAADVS